MTTPIEKVRAALERGLLEAEILEMPEFYGQCQEALSELSGMVLIKRQHLFDIRNQAQWVEAKGHHCDALKALQGIRSVIAPYVKGE